MDMIRSTTFIHPFAIAIFLISGCSHGTYALQPDDSPTMSSTVSQDETNSNLSSINEGVNSVTPQIDIRWLGALNNVEFHHKVYGNDERWDTFDETEAVKACQILHDYISYVQKYHYERMDFIVPPVPPYYFMEATHRWKPYTFVVHINRGVFTYQPNEPVQKESLEAIKEFVQYIDIFNANFSAETLAHMIMGFHSWPTAILVTHNQDDVHSWARKNAPAFHRNDDGSVVLSYDLRYSGKNADVDNCILTVSLDYQVDLQCRTKK